MKTKILKRAVQKRTRLNPVILQRTSSKLQQHQHQSSYYTLVLKISTTALLLCTMIVHIYDPQIEDKITKTHSVSDY